MIVARIRYPFDGNFPITFPFGAIPKNKFIKQKLLKWKIKGHNGIDFGMPVGTKVLAVDVGKVISAGVNGDFGIAVILEHSWGRSLYAHLNEAVAKVGQVVGVAELLGFSGMSGAATGPHLHFGIKPNNPDRNNGYLGFIDPTPYLGDREIFFGGKLD